MKEYDVLAAGYYGFGNLGDELLAAAVVELLCDSGVPRSRIALLSASPRETSLVLNVDAFDRWSLSSIRSAMKKSKSLLLGGGGLFQDSTSARSCVYYWGLVKLARLAGLKVWAVGQSIGPLHGGLSKLLARNAFASCAFRGVRDSRSLGILNSWGLDGFLSGDLVLSLSVSRDFERGNKMLLNLRPGYDKLSMKAAEQAAERAEKDGLDVAGVAFSDEDAAELKKFVDSGILKLVQITVVKSIGDYENILNGSCCAIGMRLHFIVLSALAGIPCAAVPYDPKVGVFCESWGVPIFESADCAMQPQRGAGLDSARAEIKESFRAGLCAVMGENYGKSQA